MLGLILLFLTYGLLRCLFDIRRSNKAKAQERRAAQLREEHRQMQAELREQAKRQAEFDRQAKEAARKQAETDRELARQRKEQDRQRKEQERQAEQLAKHEAELDRLRFDVKQYERDIDFLQQRVSDLDARTDYNLAMQSGTVPGSAEWDKYQRKIIVLRNQVNTAENRLEKTRWLKEQAERKLSA